MSKLAGDGKARAVNRLNLVCFAITGAIITAIHAYAQGTVNFSNFAPPVDAPVYGTGRLRLSGPCYGVQLWAGPVGQDLQPCSEFVPFGTGDSAGYYFGGTRVIPTVPHGEVAVVEVRVLIRGFDRDYPYMYSNRLTIRTGGATLIGLSSLQATSGLYLTPPKLRSHPKSQHFIPGETVTLSVEYETREFECAHLEGRGLWVKDGSHSIRKLMYGGPTLVITNATIADEGIYWLDLFPPGGVSQFASEKATLTAAKVFILPKSLANENGTLNFRIGHSFGVLTPLRVDFSQDLKLWTPLITLDVTTNAIAEDPNWGNYSQRFYRVISLPNN